MADLSTPSLLAREALKLMAARRVAPTPENFARYYHRCAGTDPPPAGDAGPDGAIPRVVVRGVADSVQHEWGALLREVIRQLERPQTGASLARKRETLERVLGGYGSDARLFDKLRALARRWDEVAEPAGRPAELSYPAMAGDEPDRAPGGTRLSVLSQQAQTIKQLRGLLAQTLESIGELVEDDRWLAAQCATVREAIATPLTAQRIGEAERRFKEIVYRQGLLKHSLGEAKATLKGLIAVFVQRLSEMTESATEYQEQIGGYAGRLQQARDLGDLEAIVNRLMSDTRGMQMDVTRHRDQMVQAQQQAEGAQSKVREVMAELERVSAQLDRDPLTGALNRRGLDEAMRREMSRAERCQAPLCVGVLDLDRFQRLDGAYGPQVSDEALMHVFSVLNATLRPTDVVARRGDEELVILFGDTALVQAGLAARRLQGELTRRPFARGDERLPITFSAGVAQFRSGDTQEVLVARAERAMRRARLQGGNRIVTP